MFEGVLPGQCPAATTHVPPLVQAEASEKSGKTEKTEQRVDSTGGLERLDKLDLDKDASQERREPLKSPTSSVSSHAFRSEKSTSKGTASQPHPLLAHGSTTKSVMTAMSRKTMNSITFKEGVTRRGIDMRLVMRGFGRILASSVGDKATWDQSDDVPFIRTFISHNWTVGRFKKFLLLALLRNCDLAAAASMAVSLPICILVASGYLPLYESETYNGETVQRSMYCLCISTFFFLAVLFFAHEVDFCRKHPAFLDKACIAQHDPVLKRAGIDSLGAFLFHSECMLVLYTDVYLQRLWTAFELGLFLTLRQGAPIVVVPVFLPQIVVIGFVIWATKSIGFEVLQMKVVLAAIPQAHRTDLQFLLGFIVVLVTLVSAVWVLRRWAREQLNIRKFAQNFSIRKAECSDERDRDLVQGNVIAYLRDLTIVDQTASDADVLDAFDRLVAKTVPRVLEGSIGQVGVPYRYVIVAFLSMSFYSMEALSIDIRNGESARVCILNLALELVLQFAGYPLMGVMFCWTMKCQLHLQGVADAIFSYGSATVLVFLVIGMARGGQALRDDAHESDLSLWAFFIVSTALFAATYCAYGGACCSGAGRRLLRSIECFRRLCKDVC